MRRRSLGPHWQAPALLSANLIAALAFALGHHAFYSSLDGTVAPAHSYRVAGWYLPQQQINLAGGTALALLVKASLATALGIAYVQVCWWSVRGRATRLTTLDTIFSGEGSPWKFFTATAAFRFPVLGVVAFIMLYVMPAPA